MTYRYIYKITCTKGSFKDNFYFGKHTTNDLDDGYKGSGLKLGAYYKRYPDDYIKEIIAFYDTEDDLNQAEYDIIHPHLNDDMCLNLMEGGHGGAPSEETRQKISEANKGRLKGVKPWITGRGHSEETKEKIRQITINYYKEHGKAPVSEETRKKLSAALKGKKKSKPAWNKGLPSKQKGVPRSEETKRKISESHKGKKHWWTPKHYSEEQKKELYKTRTGIHLSEEHKKAISIANKGKTHAKGRIWINNGIEEKMIYKDELPDYLYKNWIKGRLRKS